MSNNDLTFSFSLAQSTQAAPPLPTRYIARPFEAHLIGQEALLLAAGDDSAHRVPLFYPQALGRCDQFRTLEEHTTILTQDFGIPPSEQPAVRQGLEGLVERDLLRSENRVFEQLGGAAVDSGSDPVQTLCIRTCNRPDDLLSLLKSLSRHAADAGLTTILILDDGPDRTASAASAAAIAAAPEISGVRIEHIDRARRTRIIESLCRQTGADAAALLWLIEGDIADPEASYGSNLNLALLLTAGQRFLMIDEDALLDPYQIAAPAKRLSLRVEHQFETCFPDPDREETTQFAAVDVNPISAHAELLGQPIAAIAARYGLQGGHLMGELSPQMIYEFSQRPRLRLTTNGTLGDTGSGDLLSLYTLPATALQPWLASPDAYAQRLYSRRMARSVPETQIAASINLMTTTLTGVDNRELLLPVGAKGRGEDLVFGALIRFLHPGTPCAALPWMLPHRRDSIRRWTAEDLHRPRRLALNTYLAPRIEDLLATQLPAAPEARARVLAAWMRSLEHMDQAELITDLRRCLLERRALTAADIGKTLAELDPPEWLRADFVRLLDSQSRLDPDDSQALSPLTAPIRRFGKAYGEAMDSWLACWHEAETQTLGTLLETSR